MTKKIDFKTEDFVVYPTHGVGKILGTETQEIAGTELDLLVINFEHDRMTLRIPIAKAETSGLRRLSSRKQMDLALVKLEGRARVRRTMWSRRAQEAPIASTLLLRTLKACLELEPNETNLRIANQVNLGPLLLRFEGSACLLGRRPLLQFSFSTVRVMLGSYRLLERTLAEPKPQRMPFFALIAVGDEGNWLCARGRGGGLALWVKAPAIQR